MCVQKDRAFENPVSRKQSADPEEVSDQASLTANTEPGLPASKTVEGTFPVSHQVQEILLVAALLN